ncbi:MULTISPECIES: phosphate acyltransferase [Caldisericum]|jgi:phosphate butyryltransferase|uniref:Phosphate butyryltransferase n=1 Tax=Caldisericum exile TaxID=693075 RepID=A0A2J6WG82_9BACT|nr:MAG: phosphate butyryltransferase [Caldisericum exile]
MFKNFQEIIEHLKGVGKTPIVVVGEDRDAVEAVFDAYKIGIGVGIFIGSKEKFDKIFEEFEDKGFIKDVIDSKDDEEKCKIAVETVKNEGILLKGSVKTATLLKAVLNKDWGLRTDRIITSVAAFESNYEGREKIILLSDGGVLIRPDIDTLVKEIDNAVFVANKLGNPMPKVALLCAVEVVNPDMPETLNAAMLRKMWERGQIKGCIVDGPLALDNALSVYAKEKKGIVSDVAGDADILITPDIVSGNILGKAVEYIGGKPLAVTVVGASRPIMIPSRADKAESKLRSIALTILISK